MRKFREIVPGDVGKAFFKAFDRVWVCSDFIGRILPGDIGKRVYMVDGTLQVENDGQREWRLAKPVH